jgi:ubiquitin-conjugating enzyme E2 G1
MGPDGTLFEGVKARLVFPRTFQHAPNHDIYSNVASNIYPDGVCISILHPPGVDELNPQESAEERWRPILGVEQISVGTSMLSDPNDESPANLDAVMWRNDKLARKKVQIVRKSQEEC